MFLSITEALKKAVSFLKSRGVASPRLDAELLLSFVMQKERLYFYSHGEELLSREIWENYLALIKRRGAREPLAYLTGEKEFMGISFAVEKGVLIPRPETEHLVEKVISWVKENKLKEKLQILDLGTGCGNIVLSLLVFLPSALATGIDFAEKAVELTRRNAIRLGVESRLELRCGRYWKDLEGTDRRFHIVVSNPPYIPTSFLPSLPEEVRREPRQALDGGDDGLNSYREIFRRISAYLRFPGLLALEVGAGQAEDVCKMAELIPNFFKKPKICKDYAGIDRLVLFERQVPSPFTPS